MTAANWVQTVGGGRCSREVAAHCCAGTIGSWVAVQAYFYLLAEGYRMEHRGSRTEARQRAEDKFTKATRRDAEIMGIHRRHWEAEEAKMLPLRSLRLAKEAGDREALANAQAELSPGKGKSRRSKQPKSGTSQAIGFGSLIGKRTSPRL
jgi:hypothetical protein